MSVLLARNVAVALLLAAACAQPPPEPSADERQEQARRRVELADAKARLDAHLAEIEQRLLASQARVRLWRELQQRHASVSAVACQSLERHAASMARYQAVQQAKSDALARKNRLAARVVPVSEVVR